MSALPTVVDKKIRYYQSLREIELLAAELYPQDVPRVVHLRKLREPVRFSPGFATCRAWGVTYHFHTVSQRAICEVLWEEWQGQSDYHAWLPQKTVLLRAGLEPDAKLSRYWRGKVRHPALGVLVHTKGDLVRMGEA